MIWCFAGSYFSSLTPRTTREVRSFGRRRDDDFLGAGSDVLRRGVAIREEAGGLEHDVDAEVLPRQLRRIAQRQDLERVAVDRDRVVLGLDPGVQVAQDRVVFQQVRERCRAGQIVDGDEVDVLVAQRRAHDVAADSTEPVDTYTYCHRCPPDKRFILQYGSRVHSLQPALARDFCRRVAVFRLPGDPLQEVHRQPAPAAGVSADYLQHRRRRIHLDPRGFGRRGADRARPRRRPEDPVSAAPAVRLDDDDRRPANSSPYAAGRRRGLLFSVRLDVHRQTDAVARPAPPLHHDGDGNLAEPASPVPETRRSKRWSSTAASRRGRIHGIAWSGRFSAGCWRTSIASACRARNRRDGSSTSAPTPPA